MNEERYLLSGCLGKEDNRLKDNNKVECLENEVVNELKKLMDSEELTESRFQETGELLKKYYFEVLRGGFNTVYSYGIESISRLLTFLLTYPVVKKVNKNYIEKMYDRLCLVNATTYILTQCCKIIINHELIKGYMNYIRGTIIEARSAFCLYRVNAEYIRSSCCFYSMEKLSPKDLYYGITTGFYEMGCIDANSLGKQAICRLEKMCAYDELNKLKKDGFLLELYL